MECRVVDEAGADRRTLDRETLERLLENGFFWLDVHRPSGDELALLGEVFDLHPLALEDSAHFGQRPKLEGYDTFVFVVLYGHVRGPQRDLLGRLAAGTAVLPGMTAEPSGTSATSTTTCCA